MGRYLKNNISVLCISIIFTFMMIIQVSPANAQTQEYEFNVIEGEEINTDPTARHILDQMELSKKIQQTCKVTFKGTLLFL